jgi:hypothetical protein
MQIASTRRGTCEISRVLSHNTRRLLACEQGSPRTRIPYVVPDVASLQLHDERAHVG